MPLAWNDIIYAYSVSSGSAGATQAGSATTSLGKWISTTTMGESINDLFDNISATENFYEQVDYKCVFVRNMSATYSLLEASVYISYESCNGSVLDLAVDDMDITPYYYSDYPQAAVIATDTTTPIGVGAFSHPTTAGTALSLGTIYPKCCRAFWVRRTALGSATAYPNDNIELCVTGLSS